MRTCSLGILLAIVISLASCQRKSQSPDFQMFVSDFVFGILNANPSLATSVGYHEHAGAILDERLEDYSAGGIEQIRQTYGSMNDRLNGYRRAELPPQDQADYDIISDQIKLAMLDLDKMETFRHNPTLYVETIGNALFSPLVLDYKPKPERIRHIIARLERVPAFFDVAKRNLEDAPEIWTLTARQENEGNIALIDKEIRAQVPANLTEAYRRAAEPAIIAIRSFNTYLEKDFARRVRSWRAGPELYALKLQYTLGTQQTPDQLLEEAEKMLAETRNQMFNLARRIDPSVPSAPSALNAAVSQVLRKISAKHATPDTYFADARRDLEEARTFVREKSLLGLPARDNLKVIETPEFMRGIYSVGGFNSAPAFEPQLGAYYWLTPIPSSWPASRIESKLREYNFYGLKLLTLHEAMPGHYVQLEYSNDLQPVGRRALRTIFGSGAYVEGWAVYATGMMLDAGYLQESPELRLTFLKQQLRMIANTILDIRLQTKNMTDEEAMRLMVEDTFQEKEEASGKLVRAKLSSAQLCTYFAGYQEWTRLRNAVAAKKGAQFQPKDFHERALRNGAVPMRSLAALIE